MVLEDEANALLSRLKASGLVLACAESCTGGLVAKTLTDLPGSSSAFWGGVVSYSNDCKQKILGVKSASLDSFGAVSLEVAAEMAEGILGISDADLAFSITGIAGPEGGSRQKPVGTVCFAWRGKGFEGKEERHMFDGGRQVIREKAACLALHRMLELIGSFKN